ncbi:TetR/AcrR family transcriptional regulator [Nocardioides terrisoli]|uniref:TetR/AcrR family transcriptional regulator n=1 Tax=Nocardioides terrisoli TaxID=3388267 RepID=UPI00287B80B2|nr:TetR/AcrR family transcriptional regulator [Nocardioides marmorisolisilvae]
MSRGAGGRPRAPDADDRILTAAYELYAEKGWRGFSIGEICRRSGSGKSGIYLRWSGRANLVVAAIASRELDWASCDTGDIRSDLLALARLEYLAQTSGHYAVLARLKTDAATYPELAELTESELYRAPVRHVRGIVKRAIERGQLPRRTSTALISDLVIGAVMNRAMATPTNLRAEVKARTEEYLNQLVDLVIAGAWRLAQDSDEEAAHTLTLSQ